MVKYALDWEESSPSLLVSTSFLMTLIPELKLEKWPIISSIRRSMGGKVKVCGFMVSCKRDFGRRD